MCCKIENLGDFCSCGEISLDYLIAPFSGNITLKAEFNGSFISREIFIVESYPIEIPNIFNENYNHIIGFYNGQDLMWGQKYSLKIVNCIGVPDVVSDGDYDKKEYSNEYQ